METALGSQGDERRLLFSNYSPPKHRPLLCHLDRSAAQWRDLRLSRPFLEIQLVRTREVAVSIARWIAPLTCASDPRVLRSRSG
jgi:hypothetical protein